MNEVSYTQVAGATGKKLVMTVSDQRFTCQGPLVNIDIPLAAVRHFCVEPIETATHDACLVLTWDADGRKKSKKLPIKRSEKSFQDFQATLKDKRPDASLLDIDYREALKQMGVMSTRKLAAIILICIFAVILVVVGTFVTVSIMKG
jgi:hypothetical protein